MDKNFPAMNYKKNIKKEEIHKGTNEFFFTGVL
jgi:hypothetical protein